MRPKTLFAKSADKNGVKLTLFEHTRDVFTCGERLLDLTGRAQLLALGLDPRRWAERFRRELLMCTIVHDTGKSTSCFQPLLETPGFVAQPIRHEAVSYWIARRPEMRSWLHKVIGDPTAVELLLWAVAGHHRKFPPDRAVAEPMEVYLGHDDFRATLEWGAERLGFPKPPRMEDATIRFTPARVSVIRELEDAHVEAENLFRAIKRDRPEEARYLAGLKACLIAADVAGSIRRHGTQTMVAWMGEAFENVPSVEDLDGVVKYKLGSKKLHGFQEDVGTATERVVFVRAGCGSGKTLAAYHWAARAAARLGRDLRVFFCYPTTGTASEGYRDYLKDVDLPTGLIHGRAEVDMRLLGLGDDDEGEPGRAAIDSAGALDHWSTPLVSCTVDTVLGLLQNNRRGVYLWPSVAGAAVVFDEIHSYDDDLFAALLRFLKEMRGIPCLLMTASLPKGRLQRVKDALAEIKEPLGIIPGPEEHETIKRYKRAFDDPQQRIEETLARGGKVLWVVNTVDEAMRLYDETMRLYECGRTSGVKPLIYHSRFRYRDRVERHRAVIDAFGKAGPAIAFCTQVAELSLDLNADLLITQLAPIPALIQRLGRLNRRAKDDDPWPFIVHRLDSVSTAPYEPEELEEADAWLKSLGSGGLSQRNLVESWSSRPEAAWKPVACAWLDGGFATRPGPLRQGSPGIEIILREDVEAVRSGTKPEEVRIPMLTPRDRDWHNWDELAFCKVPPPGRVDYDPTRGARWTR